jgi:hypothetical protein
VAELREHGCDAPILSLLRSGESPIPEAAMGVNSLSPSEMLQAIRVLLSQSRANH